MNPQADIRADKVRVDPEGTSLVCSAGGELLGEIRLRLPGRHNALNALAAVAVAIDLDIDFATTADALAGYSGTDRRFQRICSANDILVVDDYGHHPTEIRAVLQTAKEGFDRRTIVCFQPHRYTRSQLLREDFGRAFYEADQVLVLPIYAAGEEPIAGVTGEDLATAIEDHGHKNVRYVPDLEAAFEYLDGHVAAGDMVITLGAGDVWKVGQKLAASLQTEETPAATEPTPAPGRSERRKAEGR